MAKEKHVVISKGNIKMGQIQSVSLPPFITCSPLAYKFCGKKCYARKMCRLRPTVKESYDNNLKILLDDKEKFWREINAAVALSTYFRFHVAGDIFNAEYLERMVDVARKNKHCQILCFTKKYDLVNSYLTKHRLPKNLHLIFSVWKGLEYIKPYNLPEAHIIYKDGTTTASDGAKYCSGNCTECATENKNCWTLKKGEQILFKEH
jgi:hypothetical protein